MHNDVIISTEWLKSRITVKTHNERNIPAIDLIIFPMRRLSSFTVPFFGKSERSEGTLVLSPWSNKISTKKPMITFRPAAGTAAGRVPASPSSRPSRGVCSSHTRFVPSTSQGTPAIRGKSSGAHIVCRSSSVVRGARTTRWCHRL